MDRITDEYQSDLEKMLSVFEQTNFVDDTKITKRFNHATDIEEVRIMTDILHHSGTDPDEKKKIETEKEAWRTFYAAVEEKTKKYEKEIKEKIKELSETKQELDETKQELDETKQELDEIRQVLREQAKIIADLKNKVDSIN